jgi:hypothetical protein
MRRRHSPCAGDTVWIADGRRGLLVRLAAGYERVAARATWRRPPAREAVACRAWTPRP